MSSKAPTPPAVPVVAPAPTREQIVAKSASDAKATAATKVKAVEDSKKAVREQQGMYNDIKTSMSGDFFYGKKTRDKTKYAGHGEVARYGG